MYADDHLSFCSGRTFPTHQYFSAQLGAGQLSLYNLLKAYSLLDTEVRAEILFPMHRCRKIRVWWRAPLSLALRNLFLFHHQGRLLPGNQLCSRRAAVAHEWGAGIWHAQVPHVRPGHQAAVQTGHGLSAGERAHTSQQHPAEQAFIFNECQYNNIPLNYCHPTRSATQLHPLNSRSVFVCSLNEKKPSFNR